MSKATRHMDINQGLLFEKLAPENAACTCPRSKFLLSIATEAVDNPELLRTARHSTRIVCLDEVTAARKPILRGTTGSASPEVSGRASSWLFLPTKP
jgi:hypothetical protein